MSAYSKKNTSVDDMSHFVIPVDNHPLSTNDSYVEFRFNYTYPTSNVNHTYIRIISRFVQTTHTISQERISALLLFAYPMAPARQAATTRPCTFQPYTIGSRAYNFRY